MRRLHEPMRSRRCNAEDAPICHWETGKAEQTMRQSQKTYRISCAGALRPWGTCRSSASCDGQDGRSFSCEKVPSCRGRGFLRKRRNEFGGECYGMPPCELHANASLRKRSRSRSPKYRRISNALRLNERNSSGASRTLFSACSTRVCLGASHGTVSDVP